MQLTTRNVLTTLNARFFFQLPGYNLFSFASHDPYIFFVSIVRVDEFVENVMLTSTLKISLAVLHDDALLKRLNELTIDIHTVEIESTCKLHQVLNRYSLPSCLKVLRIKDNSLNFEDICDLVISHSRVSTLYELDLCRTKFMECSFSSFLSVLRYLRGLSLTDNGLTKQDITNLITALKLMRNLERLNLSKSNITEAQANDILQELEQANQIISLDLSHNALRRNEIIIGICQLQSLQEVDLSHNFIKFSPLPDFEGKHDSLSTNAKNISLSSNHMMPDDISQFCSLIGSDLLKLNLDFNHVGNSIWSLCLIRLRIKHLKVLSLENIYISDASTVHGLATLLSSVRVLEELNLSSNNLVLTDFQELQKPLSNLSQLKQLNLSNNPDGISTLLEKILPSLKNLEELRLSNTHLNCDALNLLASLKSLKYLELSMNAIGLGGITVLANILKEFPLLERLDLSRSCLQSYDVMVLCHGLVPLKRLKYLNLSGNVIHGGVLYGDVWFLPPTLEELIFSDVIHGKQLFTKIKTLQNLKKLHLTNLKLSACDVEILATTLSSFPKMEELSLADIVIAANCEYDCKCYEQLFTALGNLKYLKELNLSGICITKTGAEALARVLPSLTLLEKLALGHNRSRKECNGHGLLAALRNLKYLKELDLSGIYISKTGAEALARVLPSLTLLEKLVLGHTALLGGERNERGLLAALGNLKYLKELDLSGMYINKTGVEALALVLLSLTFLEKLVLRMIIPDYECGNQLFAALRNLKYLKELDLTGIYINKIGAEALGRVLPSLTLLEMLELGVIDSHDKCDGKLFVDSGNLMFPDELDLSEVRINKTGAKALARVFPSLTLEKLVLRSIDYNECDEQLLAALGNLKYLKELDLGGMYINKTCAEALARVFPSLTLLEKLVFRSIDYNECDEQLLLAALGNLKYLKELDLGEMFISKTSAEALARVLPSLTLLEKLVLGKILSKNEYNEHALFAALGNLKNLKELDLSGVRIRKTGVEALARVLPSLTLLEKLVLGHTALLERNERGLLAALGNLKYLKELDLGKVYINKTCADALARVLWSWKLPVEKLALANIPFDDEYIERLVGALVNLKYLKELHIGHMSRTATEAFAYVLPSLKLLEKLVLRWFSFDDACDAQLLVGLVKLKYLKELYLNVLCIKKTGKEVLARVLPSLTFLEKLKLGDFDLDDEYDENALLPALGYLKYLKELDLSAIYIRKTGAKALACVLPSLTLLDKLELGEIDLDDECDERALLAALGNVKYLKVLDLSEVYINKTGAATLTTTLPRLRSLKIFMLPRIRNDEDGTLEYNLKTAASFVPIVY